MSLSKVIKTARGELGVKEEPVNQVKYWQDYDPSFQGQPWCVAFLWWCFNEAGERMAFFGGGKTASCGTLLRWYREQGLTVNKWAIQPGDIALFNFDFVGGSPEHCGLVTEVDRVGGKIYTVTTIEGNTTPGKEGSQDNGGCVAQKARYMNHIVAVCRPQYKPEEPEKIDDITGHWAEDAIRWCMAHELMTGYPDGSFQPDKPVTRAELATVLRRLVKEKEDDLK